MSDDEDMPQKAWPPQWPGHTEEDALVSISWVSYVLHLVVAIGAVIPGGQVSVVILVIALVIDLVKRDDARASWLASHFSWRIRSVLWMGVLYLITSPLFLLLFWPGWLAWFVISVWFLYRIILGAVRMNRRQAMGSTNEF